MLDSLVRHLHGFVRDVEPTIAEWEQAIAFLTATGQKCSDVRQEFILLSDVLGVSMLVETMNERSGEGQPSPPCSAPSTWSNHRPGSWATRSIWSGESQPCVVTGQVASADGTPLPGAVLDVWQADDKGFYDVQVPDAQPPGNGRGLFTATPRAGSGSARSSPVTTRSRRTGRSARCCVPPVGTPTGPRTSISSSRLTATAR